jgi:hypothetical protein
MRLRHLKNRLIALARAGSWLGPYRAKTRYRVEPVEQDGVILLMPKEPSLAFYYVPLAVVFTVGGAVVGFVVG